MQTYSAVDLTRHRGIHKIRGGYDTRPGDMRMNRQRLVSKTTRTGR
jgi:hypothetical protein